MGMDAATAAGVGGAFGMIVLANVMEGGNPASMLNIPALILVIGGTMFVSVAGGTLADAKGVIGGLKKAFTGGVTPASDVVPVVVDLADKARREGLLSLEEAMKDVDDDFLRKGVSMAVDGTDPEEVREILEGELIAKKKADKHGAKFFADAGAYAPTIGIIGTVMGLVHVLENLAEPDKLGHLIAGAFLATLWGVMSANVVWLPIASRLKRLSELEGTRMEIVIEGVSAIQAGANPRIVRSKLVSLLPESEQGDLAEAA
jgi:chemotaxis protein MotA